MTLRYLQQSFLEEVQNGVNDELNVRFWPISALRKGQLGVDCVEKAHHRFHSRKVRVSD
ncbi:hypothetical protein [Pseudomonas ogarae]|uniref:hypothetical protein n=1 Tax=Pseudomonas ogarae (strain DSM 112162 / CECT 30235 / F113) TaxID=1114970 RepID=UPI001305135F|nr:hypothetical protein [Pseudomonas ogarae]